MSERRLPSAAVVLCTFTAQRSATLREALRHVHNQTVPLDEVIVVVDHNEPLRAALAAERLPAHLLANVRTRGASGSRNTALTHVSAEVVIFLDDDASPEPAWLEHVLQRYVNCRVVAVGGPSRPLWPGNRPHWFAPELDWTIGCSLPGTMDRLRQVRNLWAVNMSLRLVALQAAGWFDETVSRTSSVPAGFEDTELCIRLKRSCPDDLLLFDPEAIVWHHVSAERCRVRYVLRRCFCEGQSKAHLCRTHGWTTLTDERHYLLDGLLGGIARHAVLALRLRSSRSELAQAVALIACTCSACIGYATGMYLRSRSGNGHVVAPQTRADAQPPGACTCADGRGAEPGQMGPRFVPQSSKCAERVPENRRSGSTSIGG